MKTSGEYRQFLSTPSRRHWERIGLARRAGVATPLFSLYSKRSIGIGELPDLRRLADWCRECGLSILLLLPMNDVGFEFRPYDAQSTFALEPMYLALRDLKEVKIRKFRNKLDELKRNFPAGRDLVDYRIKGAKLALLWEIFLERRKKSRRFQDFVRRNSYWLADYALFKALKEVHGNRFWQEWPEEYRLRHPEALRDFSSKNAACIEFHEWLQWQLFEQFSAVKRYAAAKKVLLMGDLPFLVSRDSADVWSHQNYFKLDLASGAPPDSYLALGQRWGMPPYRWEAIAKDHYRLLIERLRYAESFYDMIRIDHFVGFFRVWTIQNSEPHENFGLHGAFDPREEGVWERHGRRLIRIFLENSRLLPCAEDLGVVPACSYRTLEELGLPGMDVQRWMRDWGKTFNFREPFAYRKNSLATSSTHDMSNLRAWWRFEAGTVEEELFKRLLRSRGIPEERIPGIFDLERSARGRLRWRREIRDEGDLLGKLGVAKENAQEILEQFRASRFEREKFWEYLGLEGDPAEELTAPYVERAISRASEASSIFHVQLLQEWLSIDRDFSYDPWNFRINFPGYLRESNWRLVLPRPLEALRRRAVNRRIRRINKRTARK